MPGNGNPVMRRLYTAPIKERPPVRIPCDERGWDRGPRRPRGEAVAFASSGEDIEQLRDGVWLSSGREVAPCSERSGERPGNYGARPHGGHRSIRRVWIFWGESKALFLHLTNRCREN